MLVFRKKIYQTCMRYIQIESVLIFRKKKFIKELFFLKNKNYLIRLMIFLIFYKVITDFLNLLNI